MVSEAGSSPLTLGMGCYAASLTLGRIYGPARAVPTTLQTRPHTITPIRTMHPISSHDNHMLKDYNSHVISVQKTQLRSYVDHMFDSC